MTKSFVENLQSEESFLVLRCLPMGTINILPFSAEKERKIIIIKIEGNLISFTT